MGISTGLIIHKSFKICKRSDILQNMISKYTYKDLTWVDLESPTEKELEHMVDLKSDNALHFIISDNTLVTSRRYNTPQIATFAKNFEMNIALERPAQIENIDSLFFELLGFFRQNSEHNKTLQQKDNEIKVLQDNQNKIIKSYAKKIAFLQLSITLTCIIILYLYIWR